MVAAGSFDQFGFAVLNVASWAGGMTASFSLFSFAITGMSLAIMVVSSPSAPANS